MKYYIETIGCQQNEYDASRLSVFLKSIGLEKASPKEAEVIFIFACSVRQTAVDRVFGRIKKWVDDKKVIISSCLMPSDQKKIAKMGAIYWHFADVKELEKILNFKIRKRKINNLSKTKYVPIMSGCNNFCSYCIVPFTRGREKSRSPREVLSEVKKLVQQGYNEIILLGQNVNSYEFDFARLLKKINDLPGDFIVSFTSNHPKDFSDDLIFAIANLPKVKKEIHLPLQSGSDKILKAMNRPYTSRQYLKLVKKLKSKIKNLKLTTDIIVGFPGETIEDFQKTIQICKRVGYSLAYINKYSPRKGTAAYKLGDPVPWKEKQRRWKFLDQLINN